MNKLELTQIPKIKIINQQPYHMGALESVCGCDPPKFNQTKTTRQQPTKKRPQLFQEFEVLGNIGSGGFGEVFLVELKSNRKNKITELYALKCVSKRTIRQQGMEENIALELELLNKKISPFCIELKKQYEDSKNYYLLMEYAKGGDLYTYVNNLKTPSKIEAFKQQGETAVRFVAGCVVLALSKLHELGIMYRDLKPENILITDNGYAKLSDFGLCKKYAADDVSRTMAGSPFYLAPELVQLEGYGPQIDFWTFGIFLFQLFYLKTPFDRNLITRGKYRKACLEAEKDGKWRNLTDISQGARDLICGLLKTKPKERLGGKGWQEIKGHSFFKDFQWSKLQIFEMESPLKKIVQNYPVKIKRFGSMDTDDDDSDSPFQELNSSHK